MENVSDNLFWNNQGFHESNYYQVNQVGFYNNTPMEQHTNQNNWEAASVQFSQYNYQPVSVPNENSFSYTTGFYDQPQYDQLMNQYYQSNDCPTNIHEHLPQNQVQPTLTSPLNLNGEFQQTQNLNQIVSNTPQYTCAPPYGYMPIQPQNVSIQLSEEFKRAEMYKYVEEMDIFERPTPPGTFRKLPRVHGILREYLLDHCQLPQDLEIQRKDGIDNIVQRIFDRTGKQIEYRLVKAFVVKLRKDEKIKQRSNENRTKV